MADSAGVENAPNFAFSTYSRIFCISAAVCGLKREAIFRRPVSVRLSETGGALIMLAMLSSELSPGRRFKHQQLPLYSAWD